MTRLIDADALLKELQAKFDRAERDAKFTGSRDINVSWNDAICAIKQAKTVEAITTKWIKNYASHKASKDLIDCYWHFWEDDVLKMIEEWEKENESISI